MPMMPTDTCVMRVRSCKFCWSTRAIDTRNGNFFQEYWEAQVAEFIVVEPKKKIISNMYSFLPPKRARVWLGQVWYALGSTASRA